jgi:hypothetical protein
MIFPTFDVFCNLVFDVGWLVGWLVGCLVEKLKIITSFTYASKCFEIKFINLRLKI